MLITNKNFENIQKKAEEELIKVGIDNSPGSIARLFLSIINTEQAEFYDKLSVYHAQSFLSTAEGDYLDNIGYLLNCSRNFNEDDENYRYRISKQCLSLSKANETSIRLACLSVDGVDDIYLDNFSYGIGSFSVYILNKDMEYNDKLMSNVEDSLYEVVSYGTKFEILMPVAKEVELEVSLLFNKSLSQNITNDIKVMVKKEITNYITNLSVGETIVLNELTQIIMQQHDEILNYSIISYKIDGVNVMHTDQHCSITEKFIVSPKQRSIKVY